MNGVRLWLVRHPRPCVAEGVCYGMSDIPADARATARQAAQLAKVLPERIPLYCSPLQRCTALGQALQALRPDLVCRLDDRLRELDFGAWEGRRWSDIGQQAVDAWVAEFARQRVGGGESVQDLTERVEAALHATLACCRDGGAREAVWISHAGVIRAAIAWAGGTRRMEHASQWPAHAPACGSWVHCILMRG